MDGQNSGEQQLLGIEIELEFSFVSAVDFSEQSETALALSDGQSVCDAFELLSYVRRKSR